MTELQALTPLYTADLFPALHAALIALLHELRGDDWLRPTVAGSWRVRDVVAHLLDGDLRKLSGGRDAHPLATRPISSFNDIVDLIDELNAGGVRYAARLSPRLMTELLEVTGGWVSEYVAALPAHGPARFGVAWAGEGTSENWMDIGREYTERWHHQMQIRDAVGAARLLERRWFEPILDLSVRAFPRAYQSVAAAAGTAVVFEVDVAGPLAWSVVNQGSTWAVMRGRTANPAAAIRADADAAWKLLYNALSPDAALAQVAIDGDRRLAEPMLRARSVMVANVEQG